MILIFYFQIPLEIVDVETTGYVLRLCPFESLAFSGVSLTEDDLEAFIIVSNNIKRTENMIYLHCPYLVNSFPFSLS